MHQPTIPFNVRPAVRQFVTQIAEACHRRDRHRLTRSVDQALHWTNVAQPSTPEIAALLGAVPFLRANCPDMHSSLLERYEEALRSLFRSRRLPETP
jgi:hypothetical protein